ncbi:activity-dependent neuroprotective protein a [Phyllopteryx taeniolatus]|uniref:activity-dependent neuroprotective protein a n=1 Tax=Phyllopteryx taeniolatus TaxID=161469 RepID=UPI002AD25773|nr:activity-dependent neuroprotective protein a [Phyllopteryx taeniolatus]
MYQIPVNDLTKLRKARKQVKIALEDIGLEYCKEALNEFKDFSPGEKIFYETLYTDICVWHPAYSKIQDYRSRPYCCRECRFSSATYAGYKNHFRHAHKKIIQDRVLLNCSYCTFIANRRTLEIHVRVFHKDKLDQQISRINAVRQRQVASNKPALGSARSLYFCKKCTYRDSLYNAVRKHIYREHFKHVVAPYLRMIPKSSVPNGGPFNGDNILCKRCKFTTKTYESLVQHVIEYHERIGAQVTTMIGHANVVVSNLPSMSQKSSMIINGGSSLAVNAKAQPVIGYLKPPGPAFKSQSLSAAKQVGVKASPNTVPDSNVPGVNTSQTQKWKICTVCNELFPETLYSAHFESAHKARIVWAMAKYIMKIHNFTSKCLLCNRYLPSDTLLNHLLIHGITCPQCHSAFHSVEKLLEHERQAHLTVFVGPPGSAPLTFDLTIKQNVQLHVLTFNMKESDSKDPSVTPLVKVTPSIAEMQTQALESMCSSERDMNDSSRTMCPLCCTNVKDPVPNALAVHLRQRHQVLQTMHPVEKKMTYKCIHCLGVYTSNMVASTITLHLVQCRAVGRKQASLGAKSTLTLNSSGMSMLKRPMPPRLASYSKKIKLSAESMLPSTTGKKTGAGDLSLDPNAHKTYEARKNFLKSYFNQRPYPSPKEEKKLSASLWIWKADICKHFAILQKECKSWCETSNVSVLLGFDMQALKTVKHDIIFKNVQIEGTSGGRPGGLKSGIPNMAKNLKGVSSSLKNTCTEPILIDSDSEPEIQQTPVAKRNGDSDLHKSGSQSTQTGENQLGDSTQTAEKQVRGSTQTEAKQPSDSTQTEEKPASDSTQTEEKPPGDSTQMEQKPPGDSTQTEEKPPGDSTQTEEEPPGDSTQTEEKPPGESTQTEEKPPGDSTQTEEKPPSYSTKTEEKPPSYSTKTEEKMPGDSTQTEEKTPSDSTQTEETPPGDSTQTEEKPPGYSTQTEEKPAGYSTHMEEKPPSYSTKTEEKPPGDSTQTEEKPPGDSTQTEEKPPDHSTQTEEKQPGDSTQTEEKPPGDSTQTEEKHPGDSIQTEEKQPDHSTQTAEKQLHGSTQMEAQQSGDSTQTEEKQPDDSTQMEEKQPDDSTPTGEKEAVNTEEPLSANEISLQDENVNI